MDGDVVILTSPGDAGPIIYHGLREVVPIGLVIEERSLGKTTLVRRRARRLGVRRTAGQLLFMGLAAPVLRRRGTARIAEITEERGLRLEPVDASMKVEVKSVNAAECHDLLRRVRPRVVVLAGTRVLSRATLDVLQEATVINVHAGITPLYRGVHGAYWALYERKPELVGATVHLVDAGIDTGEVVSHCFMQITPDDTFATYPYLQLGVALPALRAAARAALEGEVTGRVNPLGLESRVRTHPTLGEYLRGRQRGVK